MYSQWADSPVVWQAEVGEGDRRLHSLVTEIVDCKDAPRILHSGADVGIYLKIVCMGGMLLMMVMTSTICGLCLCLHTEEAMSSNVHIVKVHNCSSKNPCQRRHAFLCRYEAGIEKRIR